MPKTSFPPWATAGMYLGLCASVMFGVPRVLEAVARTRRA